MYKNLPYRVKENINLFTFDNIESFDKLLYFNKICDYEPCDYSDKKIKKAYDIYYELEWPAYNNKCLIKSTNRFVRDQFLEPLIIMFGSMDGIYYDNRRIIYENDLVNIIEKKYIINTAAIDIVGFGFSSKKNGVKLIYKNKAYFMFNKSYHDIKKIILNFCKMALDEQAKK